MLMSKTLNRLYCSFFVANHMVAMVGDSLILDCIVPDIKKQGERKSVPLHIALSEKHIQIQTGG